ncbi:MAG: hypothetical protein DHS20C17_14810 [Cyclobacteriaceae bacterium]|nr:MAG: hypothetical protein DHS20C17_14810 [Cyclobacteriaceae bacterium]
MEKLLVRLTNLFIGYGALVIVVTTCQPDPIKSRQETKQSVQSGFRELSPEFTGVHFRNNLPENEYFNGFLYEYFYNGGGVAIGDLNNDGLEDIYFTSNLESNALYLNQGGMKFKDVTESSGTGGKKGWATGVTLVDINQDGWLDIYVCRSGPFTDKDFLRNELFINQGTIDQKVPRFIEQAAEYGLDDLSYSNQAAFFDFDLDGDLDMFLANHNRESPPRAIEKVIELRGIPTEFGGNKLFRNDSMRFSDISGKAGIHSNMMNYTLGLSISDLNNDGWPDIYIANDYSEPDYLYLNQKDGTYKDVAKQSLRHIPNASMGTDIADINNDALLDIMSLDMAAADNFGIKTSMSSMNPAQFYGHVQAGLHHQYMFNALQLNNGNQRQLPLFSDIAQMAGVSSTDWSWAPLLADLDNDGYKDLFITNGVKRDFINNDFNILLNKEIEKIKSKNEDPLNHFARLTQLAPTRKKENYIFRNNGNLTYSDVSRSWGVSGNSLSHGAAYADLDNDGDLDLVINNADAPASILENSTDKSYNYLSFSLVGPEKNKSGIGARVLIKYHGYSQLLEHYPTRGYLSSVSHKLHFGLGAHNMVERATITWPDGKQQTMVQLAPNQHIQVNYLDARDSHSQSTDEEKMFTDISEQTGLDFIHQENEFDDFQREGLLPHKMSQQGPALAVGDVNNDGLQDVYVGGAQGFSGSLYLQQKSGIFTSVHKTFWIGDKNYEDVDAHFFDADQDQDLDLIVVSGGNEYPEGSNFYRSRIYENNGDGSFRRSLSSGQLPIVSGSVARSADFDGDGDWDLFIGGRQKPGLYPFPVSSYLLKNESENGVIRFQDVTMELIPDLNQIGMVTDALWTDLDGDQLPELVICGEWMGIKLFRYRSNGFSEVIDTGMEQQTGWWYSLASADFDHDGDQDLVIGNHGLNNKYQASDKEPFQIYSTDFDNNGVYDIVLGYYNQGQLFPLRGRECTSNQMPFVKQKFSSYQEFGRATLADVYGIENLSSALHYQVNTFATTYAENKGELRFEPTLLGNLAQISSVRTLLVDDFDSDGNQDLVLAGNMFETEVETPRNDASYGLYLKGDGSGNFEVISPNTSGLFILGDTRKGAALMLSDGNKGIVFAKNQGKPSVFKVHPKLNLLSKN